MTVKHELHSFNAECQHCSWAIAVGENIPANLNFADEAFRQAESFARTHAGDHPGHRVVIYRERKYEIMLSVVHAPERAS